MQFHPIFKAPARKLLASPRDKLTVQQIKDPSNFLNLEMHNSVGKARDKLIAQPGCTT